MECDLKFANNLIRKKKYNDALHALETLIENTKNNNIRSLIDFNISYCKNKLKLNKTNSTKVENNKKKKIELVDFKTDLLPIDEYDCTKPVGVFIHAFYPDIFPEVINYIKNIEKPYNLYISTNTEEKRKTICSMLGLSGFDNFIVRIVPNIGLDVAPFLLSFVKEMESHDLCLKIHTKKSTHNLEEFGREWRTHLFDSLLGSKNLINSILNTFVRNPKLGIVFPKHWKPIEHLVGIGENQRLFNFILNRLGAEIHNREIEYPTGTMFWFRTSAIKPLLSLNLTLDEFKNTEIDIRDKTLAHAIERTILYSSALAGYQWSFSKLIGKITNIYPDEAIDIIKNSGEFDHLYYLTTNPDVIRDAVDPLYHYCYWGWEEGRLPSKDFDSEKYTRDALSEYGCKINPLLYKLIGKPQIKTGLKKTAIVQINNIYEAYDKADEGLEYTNETKPIINNLVGVKPIAFYFPQFHPFEENDKFWGKGFTEWTNTTKANKLFNGHYQQRLPGELGFYDTRINEVIRRQIELAKQYGIHGFCFHHYFFDGKPIMRAPYNHILADKSLDINFCLHWANEPWTVRWDGITSKKGVLMPQNHYEEDDINFFYDILPAISDSRYIRIGNKPLLIIYRPSLFPNIKKTLDTWNKLCLKHNIPGFYFALMQTSFEGMTDPRDFGFDAAIEYPPHNLHLTKINHKVELYDNAFKGNIYEYDEAIDKAISKTTPPYKWFRGVLPDWDCTPRRSNPDIFVNSNPDKFAKWLLSTARYTEQHHDTDTRFLFVNAWNEWAEGAYLEPDRKYGYGYLNAVSETINDLNSNHIISSNTKLIVGIHLFYTDLLDEFIEHLKNIPIPYDLFITTCADDTESIHNKLNKRLIGRTRGISVNKVLNIGRDMGPFILHFLPRAQNYEIACWMHTKKSPYESKYRYWRKYLLDNLVGTKGRVTSILNEFHTNSHRGIIYPEPFAPIKDKVEWGSNFNTANILCSKLSIRLSLDVKPEFPTGGMFWLRPICLEPLLKLGLSESDFNDNSNDIVDCNTGFVIDGTLAHALERMILYISKHTGYSDRAFSFVKNNFT